MTSALQQRHTTGRGVRIILVGGGYAGMTAARRLQAGLADDEASITVIDPRSYMTYQPFLAEAAAGSVEPRHVVVPLREVLSNCRVLAGEVTTVDRQRRALSVWLPDGNMEQLGYDILIMAPGSISKTLPIPGLAEQGIGFKTLEEAIYLRNHVLSRLSAASSTLDPQQRRRALTFVFVGGGYAGVEAMAELEDMARQAAYYYDDVDPDDMRWVLVEAMDRIMPEVSQPLANYTLDRLAERGFETYLETTLRSAEQGHIVLDNGMEFDSDTLVWTAGVRPSPMLAETDLPLDERGRIKTATTLRVDGAPEVFAAGDCAAVPDVTSDEPGAVCAPSAQHASRQAKLLAKNVLASLRGEKLGTYRHAYAGSVASLGLYRGVAQIYALKVKGWPAWVLHRSYHLAAMPTLHRKVRIAVDWALSLPFRRQVVATAEQHQPRSEFVRASQE